MDIIKPARLKRGDKVVLLSPSGKSSQEKIDETVKMLENMGLETYVHPHNYLSYLEFAGTDQQRADALTESFADPTIKAIVCVRGGYGCIRILDKVDYSIIKKNPKILTGMSDITILQNAILSNTGLITYQTVMTKHIAQYDNDLSIGHFEEILFDDGFDIPLDGSTEVVKGTAYGQLIGGNLSSLRTMFGTSYDSITDDCVLFFESYYRYLYEIDQFLTQLKHAGKFHYIKGVIVGENLYKKNEKYPVGLEEILKDNFGNSIPIIIDVAFGHQERHLTMPLGQNVRLDVDKENSMLTLLY